MAYYFWSPFVFHSVQKSKKKCNLQMLHYPRPQRNLKSEKIFHKFFWNILMKNTYENNATTCPNSLVIALFFQFQTSVVSNRQYVWPFFWQIKKWSHFYSLLCRCFTSILSLHPSMECLKGPLFPIILYFFLVKKAIFGLGILSPVCMDIGPRALIP